MEYKFYASEQFLLKISDCFKETFVAGCQLSAKVGHIETETETETQLYQGEVAQHTSRGVTFQWTPCFTIWQVCSKIQPPRIDICNIIPEGVKRPSFIILSISETYDKLKNNTAVFSFIWSQSSKIKKNKNQSCRCPVETRECLLSYLANRGRELCHFLFGISIYIAMFSQSLLIVSALFYFFLEIAQHGAQLHNQ